MGDVRISTTVVKHKESEILKKIFGRDYKSRPAKSVNFIENARSLPISYLPISKLLLIIIRPIENAIAVPIILARCCP